MTGPSVVSVARIEPTWRASPGAGAPGAVHPRVCGKPGWRVEGCVIDDGSIPACAGKP